MDDNQHTPVSDDQELANVLAGMNQQAAAPVDPTADDLTVVDPPTDDTAPLSTPELKFEETPLSDVSASEESGEPAPAADELPAAETPVEEVAASAETPVTQPDPVTSSVTPAAPSELDDIKKTALEELRPLVDKLDLPADEKFDTLLLIIRSTDDKSLVNAAHEAARAITDETKRAQALLDVIKEIDYFSGHGEQPVA